MGQQTYLFKELYIETIIRSPEKVGFSAAGLHRLWGNEGLGFGGFGFRIAHEIKTMGRGRRGASSSFATASP